MKRFSFLPVVVLAALMVFVASCTVPMGATGDYYEDAPARANVYYGDPYYGGGNTIIVERDPYTGRYYQVSPGYYGRVNGARAYGYGQRPHYNKRYNNNNRNYNPNRSGNGYYKNYPQRQQAQPKQIQPQQTPAQRQQMQQQRNEAKGAILGKPRS